MKFHVSQLKADAIRKIYWILKVCKCGMMHLNFYSVTVYNSAVIEFWPLPLEQRIKLFLISLYSSKLFEAILKWIVLLLAEKQLSTAEREAHFTVKHTLNLCTLIFWKEILRLILCQSVCGPVVAVASFMLKTITYYIKNLIWIKLTMVYHGLSAWKHKPW